MKKSPAYKPLQTGSSEHYRYLAGRAYVKGDMKRWEELEAIGIKALIAEQEAGKIGLTRKGMVRN